MNSFRLLVDEPQSGAWNMALDEALMEHAAAKNLATLRLYRWRPATLSLGYFQRHEDRALHAASSQCELVRRSSGGGAILHDREWTYSLIVPEASELGRQPLPLYRLMHRAFIAAAISLAPQLAGEISLCENPPRQAPRDEPFLCFQRRAAGDVVLRGSKIIGSAQRRRHGAVLQHGSVLFARSNFAPELPGLFDLGLSPQDEGWPLMQRTLEILADEQQFVFTPGTADAAERAHAAQLQATRFGTAEWTLKR